MSVCVCNITFMCAQNKFMIINKMSYMYVCTLYLCMYVVHIYVLFTIYYVRIESIYIKR